MSKKLIYRILLIVLSAVLVFFAFLGTRLFNERNVKYDFLSDLKSVSNNRDVIRFAGGKDFSPFAYIDEDGLPCGRDVELAFAIGRELGCRVEVTLGDWTNMQSGILNGTYDVLMTVDYSDERSKIMGYTSPTCLDSYVFFGKNVHFDVSDISRINSIRIAALDGGGATDNYIIPMNLVNNTTYYDSQLEAFESVVKGENDVAIAGYIYGSKIIDIYNLDLVQVGNSLYGSAYYLTYDINNEMIGAKLNSALNLLESNGELARIEEKWTTHFQPKLTLIEYIQQNLQSVINASLVLLLLIIVVTNLVFASNRKRKKELLEKDYLTGLLNMHSFLERMERIIYKNQDRHYVLARFDLDSFKSFNNTFGTQFGDDLLKNIGHELIKETGSDMIVLKGYLGSDHFVLLCDNTAEILSTERLFNYISEIVSKSCPGYSLSIRLGLCSIDDPCEDLFRYCDRALVALRTIKNNYYRHWAWYDDSLDGSMEEEKLIVDKMFKALEDQRFVAFFQPQFEYKTQNVCGAEALCRWIDYDNTIIPPSKFIPIFEKTGFIFEMDKYIWRQCCKIVNRWKEKGIMPDHISVNISRADIYHCDLVDTIRQIFEEENASYDDIYFEITETAYFQNSELLIDTVNKLKLIGAHVEMDDFGSGYSSLSSLKNLDVDTIKLDMSLIENNSLIGKDAALLSAIINLGHALNLDIIAEGIEQEEQAQYLYDAGCKVMQGYFFSKPLDIDTFEKLILEPQFSQLNHGKKNLNVI